MLYNYALYGYGSSGALATLMIIALLLAIAATVLAFIFIVPEKKRDKLGKFGKFLHDTCNFKYLIIEKILQALYIFFTAMVILIGFFMLFCSDWNGWMGGKGILLMILGPIAVRLSYELIMLAVLAVKNIISINNKLRNQNEGVARKDIFDPNMSSLRDAFGKKEAPIQAAPVQAAPAAPVAPVAPAAPVEQAGPVESAPAQETKDAPEQ